MSSRQTRSERRVSKRRNQRIAIVVVLLLIVVAVGAFIFLSGKNKGTTSLKIEDLVVGTGQEAKAGNLVSVNYTGWLTGGAKFDSSLDRNQPLEFTLGKGQVIQGWDQGVVGMKVGGKRKLTIPPNLAYGAQGAGSGVIPPNATLVFEVELLSVK
jgi:FKBP-type peptidyl-prolyl cis-trans isomerase FkpA